jgi:predicted ATP-grasp superfamily ATP-dependent carboligase
MYEIVEDLSGLRTPVLLVTFDGWVSAGAAGTATADHVAPEREAREVAVFDADALFDFRVNRPTATFEDGRLTQVEWPRIAVRLRALAGRDLLVLSGPEPNWRWQEFGRSVADLAVRLGVVESVSLGGIPWATPHTRPTTVVTTASRGDLIGVDANYPEGTLHVPAAVTITLERALADSGVPTAGFWARVPHYVAGTYYPAVVALVERLSRHLGVEIPLAPLVEESAAQRRHLDALVADRPEARTMVERLEQLADTAAGDVSGEDLAAEIERFLREESDGFG